MENVFKGKPELIQRRYDMKGSTFARKVLHQYSIFKPSQMISKTLKDIDFLNLEINIEFPDNVKQRIHQ